MVNKPRKIHFIGIGGVGMSGIALVAKSRGVTVSGSDMKESRATKRLVDAGIDVMIGHDAGNLADDLDAVVISSAIPEKNPELAEARRRGIPVWHRSQALASLGEGKKTLACAGTHGKTTTSSMLATTIDRMGLDPSFVIGGTVDGYDTNAKSGTGDYYVVEADESDGSFVHLSPHVALVTNIEPDHLDHYGSLEAIYEAFADFLSLIPDEGAAVVCADNPRLAQIAREVGKRTVVYGEKGSEGCDVCFEVTGRRGLGYAFTVTFPDGSSVGTEITKNPGRHNVLNATGVLGVIWACGLDVNAAARALATLSERQVASSSSTITPIIPPKSRRRSARPQSWTSSMSTCCSSHIAIHARNRSRASSGLRSMTPIPSSSWTSTRRARRPSRASTERRSSTPSCATIRVSKWRGCRTVPRSSPSSSRNSRRGTWSSPWAPGT